MKLIVYVNDTFEEEKALFNLEDNIALVKGDYYHDKIDERIEGFLEGLDYCEKPYELLESENITSKNEHFDNCGFCSDGECDEYETDEDEFENDEYDDKLNEVCENIDITETPIHAESKHLINNYRFYIYNSEYENGRRLYTQNIIEAIEEVRNCEGDLYNGDDIVYSCLGLDFEDNIGLVNKYGVEYDEELGFIKR